MAVSEKNMLLTGKDSAGNNVLLYPVTKLECVDGADELLSFTENQELTDEQKQIALQNLGITGGDSGVKLPEVTASDAGKFLRVSAEGVWAAETIPSAEEASF